MTIVRPDEDGSRPRDMIFQKYCDQKRVPECVIYENCLNLIAQHELMVWRRKIHRAGSNAAKSASHESLDVPRQEKQANNRCTVMEIWSRQRFGHAAGHDQHRRTDYILYILESNLTGGEAQANF